MANPQSDSSDNDLSDNERTLLDAHSAFYEHAKAVADLYRSQDTRSSDLSDAVRAYAEIEMMSKDDASKMNATRDEVVGLLEAWHTQMPIRQNRDHFVQAVTAVTHLRRLRDELTHYDFQHPESIPRDGLPTALAAAREFFKNIEPDAEAQDFRNRQAGVIALICRDGIDDTYPNGNLISAEAEDIISSLETANTKEDVKLCADRTAKLASFVLRSSYDGQNATLQKVSERTGDEASAPYTNADVSYLHTEIGGLMIALTEFHRQIRRQKAKDAEAATTATTRQMSEQAQLIDQLQSQCRATERRLSEASNAFEIARQDINTLHSLQNGNSTRWENAMKDNRAVWNSSKPKDLSILSRVAIGGVGTLAALALTEIGQSIFRRHSAGSC